MNVEVIAVGTELLLGQITDTNSSWIGEQLALAGLDSHYQTKVGDNPDRMRAVISQAIERSDAVIITGGLGPTHDDITREIIAEVLGRALVRDESLVEKIRAMFESRGRTMPDNNLAQADIPEGGWPMAQQPGTAAGLVVPVDPQNPVGVASKVIYAMPGVPHEMYEMMLGTVIGDLIERSGETAIIKSRTLRTWGASESGLAEQLAEEISRLDATPGGVTLAFNASGIEGLKIRLTAKSATEAEVTALLDVQEQRVRAVVGPIIFGVDGDNMEAVVLAELGRQELTLGTAESLTGGMIASRLVDIPGASAVFRGGVVSYASDIKFDLLGVERGPVVSSDAVAAMASGAAELLKVDAVVAVTGVAGPDPQDGIEPGTVWMATMLDGEVETQMAVFPADRSRIRQYTTITVLDALRKRLITRIS
ncbi:MAG: CinA family nicotinamide mononucleotide deamidase-related protein [Acidimicrobiales bacterium]